MCVTSGRDDLSKESPPRTGHASRVVRLTLVTVRITATEEVQMGTRRTGPKAAKAASKVLRDGRTSKASKTAAGSALSQAAPKPKGR